MCQPELQGKDDQVKCNLGDQFHSAQGRHDKRQDKNFSDRKVNRWRMHLWNKI